MIELALQEIASATAGRLPDDTGDLGISGDVVTDSRQAGPGSLFVALPGERVDGHDYLGAAAEAGAVAALVTREIPGAPLAQIVVDDATRALGDLARRVLATLREGDHPPLVIGITGSVGKTSTKDLLAALLEPAGEMIAPIGSYNNEIGLPLTVLRARRSTAVLVLEMGADAPGNLAYLAGIAPPDIAVVLAVGRAHLDGFGDIEAVAAAKAELVQHMRPDGVAVLNADDHRVAAMSSLAASARTVLFGREPTAQVRAEHISSAPDGRARFTLHLGGTSHQVNLALIGEHQVSNALAAAAVALQTGVPAEQIVTTLASAGARSGHRMDVRRTAEGLTIIDDSYNANPDSMRAALRSLHHMAGSTGGRAVAVLGPMRELGPDSVGEHERLGAFTAESGTDLLVTVAEEPGALATGALTAGMAPDAVQHVAGVAEAVTVLQQYLRAGDVVLVKASNGERLWRVAAELGSGR